MSLVRVDRVPGCAGVLGQLRWWSSLSLRLSVHLFISSLNNNISLNFLFPSLEMVKGEKNGMFH